MVYRDLEKVRVMVKEATDLDIAYAYDDLVFPENTAFIIRYDQFSDEKFSCFFRIDCLPEARQKILNDLCESFVRNGCELDDKGNFRLEQKEREVEIHFIN